MILAKFSMFLPKIWGFSEAYLWLFKIVGNRQTHDVIFSIEFGCAFWIKKYVFFFIKKHNNCTEQLQFIPSHTEQQRGQTRSNKKKKQKYKNQTMFSLNIVKTISFKNHKQSFLDS